MKGMFVLIPECLLELGMLYMISLDIISDWLKGHNSPKILGVQLTSNFINLVQQKCCGKEKDFICFCNTSITWFLNDTDYRMCVKTAVEAVKILTICWFSTGERKWWQQSCNGTMKGKEKAVDGFCSWICRDQCSFQCWRWR